MRNSFIPDFIEITIRWYLPTFIFLRCSSNYLLNIRFLFRRSTFILKICSKSILQYLFPLFISHFDSLDTFLYFCWSLIFFCLRIFKRSFFCYISFVIISGTSWLSISLDSKNVFLRFFLIRAIETRQLESILLALIGRYFKKRSFSANLFIDLLISG